VDYVVCTLAVKKKIRAGFDMSDRTIPLLEKIGWGGMEWINLAQDRVPVEGSCEHYNEPSDYRKCEVLE
jgi:hypothetical protein